MTDDCRLATRIDCSCRSTVELRAPRPFSLILAGRGRPALHGLRRRYKIGAKDGVDPQVAASNLYPSVQDEVARLARSPGVRSAFGRVRPPESPFALWPLGADPGA